MPNVTNLNLDYERTIKLVEGVYWVGFHDIQSGLHCNPYLIVDGDEAVVIDGGSRPDFPTVIMKILQTGIDPSSITALIYQHYDPDLCGSIPNYEDIINRDDLKIISDAENNMFIRHYSVSSELISLERFNNKFEFSSGRQLQFTKTPYSHSAGSFVTFDPKTGVLFSSDLFGSVGQEWELFLELGPQCRDCTNYNKCPLGKKLCPLSGILNFHKRIMTSVKALKYALEQIAAIPFSMIAPQHGSVIFKPEDIIAVVEHLSRVQDIGIDRILGDRPFAELGDITSLTKRLESHER